MMKTTRLLFAGAVLLGTLAMASPARANYAAGYHRPVNILVAGFWLHHTYSYYAGTNTWECYGGDCSGGNQEKYTTTIDDGEKTCMANASNLTYAVTGVCHQATNRGIHARTPIGTVLSWGDVGGAGTSNSLFCTYGRGTSCYGAPC
jgi:hypothetical protein